MTDINALTNLGGPQTSTQQAQSKLNQDFDDFLTLLTTQMQYQDPLDPMESSEFTNQLVQFSQVEQQINTNQKLDFLVDSLTISQTQAAMDYIGLEIEYAGSSFEVSEEGAGVNFGYSLPESAAQVSISVLDEGGAVIWTGQGPSTAGSNRFTWDGTVESTGNPAPPGTYTVQVGALDADDNPIPAEVVVPGRVTGIETANGQTQLMVGSVLIPQSSVIAARDPSLVTN